MKTKYFYCSFCIIFQSCFNLYIYLKQTHYYVLWNLMIGCLLSCLFLQQQSLDQQENLASHLTSPKYSRGGFQMDYFFKQMVPEHTACRAVKQKINHRGQINLWVLLHLLEFIATCWTTVLNWAKGPLLFL